MKDALVRCLGMSWPRHPALPPPLQAARAAEAAEGQAFDSDDNIIVSTSLEIGAIHSWEGLILCREEKG